MKSWRSYLWPLAILLLVKILFLMPLLRVSEHKAQDSLFRVRGARALSDSIVIIAIDDASDSALDMRWPYPREYHARLIDNLFRLGARKLVFDIAFTETADPASDSLLASRAGHHCNTIFAGKLLQAANPGEPSRLLTPISPILNTGLPWGIVNISPDLDNVIRKYTMFDMFDTIPMYSLGVTTYHNSHPDQKRNEDEPGSDAAGDAELVIRDGYIHSSFHPALPFGKDGRALINYYGPAGHFPYVSYASVIDDSSMTMPGYYGVELDEFYYLQDMALLKDKIVLIGATMDELHDKFPTPLGGDWTPGVEIHANYLEMALRQDFLRMLNPWYFSLLLLSLLLLFWYLFKRIKPQYAAIILIVLIIIQYALALYLFSSQNLLLPILETALALILLYVLSLILHYLKSMKEKQFIRKTFQQYMAPDLVNELLKNPGKLSYGGTYQEISVLFSDIRSFTTYTESHNPTETVNILKEYLTAMVSVIIRNKGTLDKFVGDEIMALYGSPLPLENHALHACKTALEMREKLAELQDKWKAEGKDSFEMGVGINTGGAIVGNLGSEQIFDYTAIGDTINLGARLESTTKEYNTAKHIIISEATYEKVKDYVEARYLDEVKVKGKNISVKIYELLDIKDQV
ncbi:MAG: adenylate/guanylate cyclase domain-containing protein [Candidatus Cloacimonetes bacterium]|nr:adenylate/guanylate cyclase domain-containing protein [Candidatus Cloacimonadota bacterium]